jgi:hypothetical protein
MVRWWWGGGALIPAKVRNQPPPRPLSYKKGRVGVSRHQSPHYSHSSIMKGLLIVSHDSAFTAAFFSNCSIKYCSILHSLLFLDFSAFYAFSAFSAFSVFRAFSTVSAFLCLLCNLCFFLLSCFAFSAFLLFPTFLAFRNPFVAFSAFTFAYISDLFAAAASVLYALSFIYSCLCFLCLFFVISLSCFILKMQLSAFFIQHS